MTRFYIFAYSIIFYQVHNCPELNLTRDLNPILIHVTFRLVDLPNTRWNIAHVSNSRDQPHPYLTSPTYLPITHPSPTSTQPCLSQYGPSTPSSPPPSSSTCLSRPTPKSKNHSTCKPSTTSSSTASRLTTPTNFSTRITTTCSFLGVYRGRLRARSC
jgi:hypothetical protein